ncbi:MAG: UDP-N-acetylglucosamine--N-acetylmuramyl-(pentapeptide) pyrophosphoryl-undecaprenol N-acetylglucosamine transferase [Patescibacteria group bacterium]
MRIGLVGGGTGGHFYPLLAVAHKLSRHEARPELYYFGPNPYDRDSLTRYNISYHYVPAGKLRRYFSLNNFFDVFRTLAGIVIAVIKLYIIYPDVIFSKGGYTSIPVLLAARFLRIPVVIHESDAVPGRANKVAVGYARYIGIAYDDAAQYFPPEKTALIGIPLRPELDDIPDDPFAELGIPHDAPLLYITGGSLGAERLNEIVLRSLHELLPHYRVLHQTGAANIEALQLSAQSLLPDQAMRSRYYLVDTLPAVSVTAALAAASVVITRAGSTTLYEIAHHGKPAIIVPIPEDVSRDQRTNAYAFARTGAASVIEEHNLTPHLLSQEIHSIISDHDRYQSMAAAAAAQHLPDAARKIAEVLIAIGIEHGS